MRAKADRLEDRMVKQDDGGHFRVRALAQEEEIAVWAQAAEDTRSWWSINGEALRTDGDLTVVPDADRGLEAPDIRPPGATGNGAEHRMFLSQGLSSGGLGGGA